MKNIIVAFFIVSIIVVAGKWRLIKNVSKAEFLYLLLIGLVGGALPFYFYFEGLSQIPAINSALIHKTLVFWVVIFAAVFFKEKMTKLQMIAVSLLFIGNLFIGGFRGFLYIKGEVFVLIATILWAVENVLSKKILLKIDPDLVIAARMGFGSLFLLILINFVNAPILLSPSEIKSVQWFWLFLTALLLLGYVISWYRSLKYISSISATSILASSTLITNILSAIFVTHVMSFAYFIQNALIVSGLLIFFISLNKAVRAKKPSAILCDDGVA